MMEIIQDFKRHYLSQKIFVFTFENIYNRCRSLLLPESLLAGLPSVKAKVRLSQATSTPKVKLFKYSS